MMRRRKPNVIHGHNTPLALCVASMICPDAGSTVNMYVDASASSPADTRGCLPATSPPEEAEVAGATPSPDDAFSSARLMICCLACSSRRSATGRRMTSPRYSSIISFPGSATVVNTPMPSSRGRYWYHHVLDDVASTEKLCGG
jgi:hypothetical protein